MKQLDVEPLTNLAVEHQGEPAGDRILALDPQERAYLSHIAILTEYIGPEDIALFLSLCGLYPPEDAVVGFVETGLSYGVLEASVVDGSYVPLFRVTDSIRKYYDRQFTEEEKEERHAYASQFYKSVLAALLPEVDDDNLDDLGLTSDAALMSVLVDPGGLIDFGAHRTQQPGLHMWTVSRALCWQHHLFELREYEEAAQITNSICFTLARMGQDRLAKSMLARNISVCSGLQKIVAMANLAALFRRSREYEKALSLYRKCVWPLIRMRAGRQLAGVFSGMSTAYRYLGRLSKALGFQHLSNFLRICFKDVTGRAVCSNQLANLYRSLGKYRLALKYARFAERHWRHVQDEVGLGRTLLTMGNIFNFMGQCHGALDRYEESLVINTRIGSFGEVASAMTGKARAYIQLGDYEKAKELLDEAISLRERLNDHSIGIEYQMMGALYEQQGNLPLALGWYQKALPLLQTYQPFVVRKCRQSIAALQDQLRLN